MGRGGSGGVGVVWRLRSNAERGMAAGGMWVGGLVVVVGWDLRLRVLTGWVMFGVVSQVGRWVAVARQSVRCVKRIGWLGVGWDWVAILRGGVSAGVVVVARFIVDVGDSLLYCITFEFLGSE